MTRRWRACYLLTKMSALTFLRAATAAGFVLALGSMVSTSCATPDFDFGDGPSTSFGGKGNPDHCSNRTKDADETDVDCGGLDCDECGLGRECAVNGDCENGSCTGGKCQAAKCTDRVKNGLETDVDCGGPGTGCAPCGTGRICEKNSNCASGVCLDGECQAPTCKDRTKNQGEVDVDCGGECGPCEVGRTCFEDDDCRDSSSSAEFPAEAVCNDGACELVCKGKQRDCNEKASDGCEANIDTTLAHCGACGNACAPANAEGQCDAGECVVLACEEGYADVNGKPGDGCEVHHLSDPKHCGTSPTTLVACSRVNGTASCEDGVCRIACNDGFDDCNENVADGCEANLRTSTNHCTECGNRCAPQGNLAGLCDPDDADDDGEVCELTDCPVALGTDTSCTTCGVACGSNTPYCHGESVGCKAHKPLGVAQRQQLTFNHRNDFSGTTNNFNVVGAPSGNRLLVVGVSRRANNSTLATVRYGTTDLTQIATRASGSTTTTVYALSECELAAAGNQAVTVSVPSTGDNFGFVVVDAVLFQNAAPAPNNGLTQSGTSATASFPSTVIAEEGWFYGIAAHAEAADWNGASPTTTLTTTRSSNDPQHKVTASVWGPLEGGGTTFGWTLSGSASWISAGVPLAPATASVTCP